MADIYPSLDGFRAVSPGQQCELDVVRRLGAALPAGYGVFHGVLWSSLQGGRQTYGEIDAIVLSPAGHLVLIEVKSGAVEFSDKGIRKHYSDGAKDVTQQLHRHYAAFRQRLKEERLPVRLGQVLVAPDAVARGGTIGYPRERIVDTYDFVHLAERILNAMPEGVADPGLFKRMQGFLSNLYGLEVDPTARIGWLNGAVTALANGLATWAPRITSANGRVLIRATAGSGKTQLAIRLLRDAEEARQQAAYVCFNRPLADHLRAVLPGMAAGISTFHELAVASLRQQQGEPDFSNVSIFEQAVALFCGESAGIGALDLLIVDEAQDFDPQWLAALQRRMATNGRLYVLLDEEQSLYRRSENDVSQVVAPATVVEDWDNFRSPRAIVQAINALGLTAKPVVGRCPVLGEIPGFHTWQEGDSGGMAALDELVARLLAEGLGADQLVLLSYRGRERSALLQREAVAGLLLRRFSGEYDGDGTPIWTQGDLLAETLFRFKGQAAPVVVLCEIDFAELDAAARHRLFVGMTRASWRLECLMSQQATQAVMKVFSA